MADRRQVPDVLLERFLADDLGPDMRRHIEAERDGQPEVRTRLEELTADKQAFLASDPPAEFARRLAGRLEMEGAAAVAVAAAPARPRRWVAWLLGPSLAAAAAASLVVMFTVTRSSDETTAVLMDPASQTPAVAPTPTETGEPVAVVTAPTTPAMDKPDRRPGGVRAKSRKPKKSRKRSDGKTTSSAPKTPPPPPKPTPRPESEPTFDAAGTAALEAAPSPPAEPSEDSGAGSGLSQRQIMSTVKSQIRDLQACAKPSEDVPVGPYSVVIAWTVTPRGSVDKARLEKPKSLRKTTLSRCLVREMRTWKFPSASGSTPVSVPLRFEVK